MALSKRLKLKENESLCRFQHPVTETQLKIIQTVDVLVHLSGSLDTVRASALLDPVVQHINMG